MTKHSASGGPGGGGRGGPGTVTFGSVCSGIEAASVAWNPLGWSAAWVSEIESFPCAVLRHHYPTVPNLWDMRNVAACIRTGLAAAPDVFCGGTPCQSFSVAGLRASLGDARGNLSLTFCEIANAIDDQREQPCVIFWENVPGVLSTADNAFGCFLAGLAGEDAALVPPGGRWANAGAVLGPRRTVAWRTLDAQYFGLAQRRRRVFVVASARNDFDPIAVLLEREGVRRDTAPRREAGETVAGGAGIGATGGGGGRGDVTHSLRAEGFDASEDGTGRGTPLVAMCLNAHGGLGPFDAESETLIPFDTTQITSATNRSNPQAGDPCHSITSGGHPPTIAFSNRGVATGGLAETLRALSHGALPMAATADAVRRLTPKECERLQGFPDDYSLVPFRGKPAADGPRYRALGNSWPVHVVTWIGRRMSEAL